MSNKKKRLANRRKQYKGSSASVQPTIVKVSAVKRPPLQQWWVDNKRIVKPLLTVAVIALIVILLIVGIISIFI